MTDYERAQRTEAADLLFALTDYRLQVEYQAGRVYIYDSAGFRTRLNASARVAAKAKELKEKLGAEVYAVTHEHTPFGECYSFLIVPKESEDWDKQLHAAANNVNVVYAYVWNVTEEMYSESGYVAVKYRDGLLKRIG